MELNVLIGLICTILGLIISYTVMKHNFQKDFNSSGRETGTVSTEIIYIKANIEDLKEELKEQRKINTELTSKIVTIEASTKRAHERIDLIDKGGGYN